MTKNKFILIISFIVLFISLSVNILPLRTPSKASANSLNTQSELLEHNEVYAILRPDADGKWYILDDDDHTPYNADYVEQNNGFLTLHFTKPLTDIYWSSVTPDETLTLNGVGVGASVDHDKTRIYLAQKDKGINPNKIHAGGANIWVYINGER